MEVLGVVIAGAILLGVYGVFFYAFWLAGGFRFVWPRTKSAALILVAELAATVLFVALTVAQNDFVYYWDYGYYWMKSVLMANDFFASPWDTFKAVYHSINQYEYNDFLPLLMSLPIRVFGNSFATFVLLSHVMFLIPTLMVLMACLNRIGEMAGSAFGDWKTVLLNGSVCFFPIFYYAMLEGYIDVAQLLPISLIFLLTLDCEIFAYGKNSLQKDILLGLLLVLVLIFRRYTAFFVVGYVGSLAILSFVFWLWQDKKITKFLHFVKHYGVIGITSLGILVVLFRPFLVNALTTDYAAQYVAYDAPWTDKLAEIINRYGLVTLILILGTLVITLFWYRKLLWFVGILLLSMVISVAGFFRVQSMAEHHAYIIAVQVALLVMIGIREAVLLCRGKKWFVIPLLSIALCAANFSYCYLPRELTNKSMDTLFATQYKPFVRNDMEELERLISYLNELTADNEKKVYAVASGEVLNCDIIRAFYKPDNTDAVPALLGTADIDLRDGFSLQFFEADIVVTTNPIELHTAEGTQEVIRFLAQEIMDENSVIGKCFEKKETFSLDRGVTAIVYVRTKDYTQEEINYIREYYSNYYPEHGELFDDRFKQYLSAL